MPYHHITPQVTEPGYILAPGKPPGTALWGSTRRHGHLGKFTGLRLRYGAAGPQREAVTVLR
jgi:hypothetical protein